MPTVLADESDLYLVFELGATAAGGALTGLITWHDYVAVQFGFPNQEVQHGHRVWREKDAIPPYYGAVEVIESNWIAELVATERVHPNAPEAPFAKDRHFVLLFHDSTFECVAAGFDVERRSESPAQVVAELAANRIARVEASRYPSRVISRR